MTQLATTTTQKELDAVRILLREYAASIGVDLCFQDFEVEPASLPGRYTETRGALLTTVANGALAGWCALRPLDNVDYANACETKRLFAHPAFRGLGLGRSRLSGHYLRVRL